MKKSEIYRLAQGAVILDNRFPADMKLEILRELMTKEDLEKFVEQKEEAVG